MARVISVSNNKGGVGKTTIVANLGFILARQFKVLLVDVDPQANLSIGLGLAHHQMNLVSYFKEVIHFRLPKFTPHVINSFVDIIPASIDLIQIENQLHETLRSEFVLKEILDPLKRKYDLIILDCPPSFNLLTLNALYSSNLIIVPAKPEAFSIHGIDVVKAFADSNAIPFKIIFNQVNKRTLLHREIIQNAGEQFPSNLLNQTIRNTIVFAEAFQHAQDVFHYKCDSNGASDFMALADELLPYL